MEATIVCPPMTRKWIQRCQGLLPLLFGLLAAAVQAAPLIPASARTSPLDLQVSGLLPGGRTNGFITRDQLMSLPLTTVTNAQDGALKRSAIYRGVPLTELGSALAVDPKSDVIFMICADGYAAHVDASYLKQFSPLLILEIDGQGPEKWGRSLASGLAMAPFYVNSGSFQARLAEKLAGIDEGPIYPYAVARLDFTTSFRALGPLRLPGEPSASARLGERLAVRDCLSCHDHRGVGGVMSNRPWALLKTWSSNTNYFRRYVVKPKSVQPASRMPGFTHYNEEALDALQAYFREWKDPGAAR